MLEAMSYGRMIISTRVGDAERLILNNKTGFLIEALTFDLLDGVLDKAWYNREYWQEMGVLSREQLYKTITSDPVLDFSKKILKIT